MLMVACCIIVVGILYIIRLTIHINWLESEYNKLLEEHWEIRRHSRLRKPKT
jgi:hypothetical protein